MRSYVNVTAGYQISPLPSSWQSPFPTSYTHTTHTHTSHTPIRPPTAPPHHPSPPPPKIVINLIGATYESRNFSFEDVHATWPAHLAALAKESPLLER
jgi:hypothetical protein